MPHLNLQKIINMSDQHQGVLQATINNEGYEIRHARSLLSPHMQIFLMRDQDRELLVNKKLLEGAAGAGSQPSDAAAAVTESRQRA
nr:Sensor-like histidine kinase RcsD [Candidatus Pantoea persica]